MAATLQRLVIVESPAKTAKIQGFLGPGWTVVATMGHIRALKEDLAAVGLDRDFEPTYEWMTRTKKKAIDHLKTAAADVKPEHIYLAADDDREGEGIAYAVALLLKINPLQAKRAVFHEITARAVLHAVEHPRPMDMNKVHSQQARAMLDLMVGFTISPLLCRSIAPSLSAGRCQTPALRLVVDREEEIERFQSAHSWILHGQWSAATPASTSLPFDMVDELEDEDSALTYLEIHQTDPYAVVTQQQVKPWTESAPDPLITSSLQQQASALFGLNPKATMSIAQRLYEAGKITYMRTDCAVLSEEATQAAHEWIRQTWGEAYIGPAKPPKTSKTTTSKPKKSKKDDPEEVKPQEAHEAIRPVHVEEDVLSEDSGNWGPLEKKVYALIRQRTLQSVMASVRGERCEIQMQWGDDPEFPWTAQWKQIVFDGWRRAGRVVSLDDGPHEEQHHEEQHQEEQHQEDSQDRGGDEKEPDAWATALAMVPGTRLTPLTLHAEPKETRARGRYTEATLIRDLESKGIGRPSTYASLLTTIQDRGYVEIKNIAAVPCPMTVYTWSPGQWPPKAERITKKVGAEKNKMVPTPLGRSALHYLLSHFDDLFAYTFTAEMERQLDEVARGDAPWKQPLRRVWESYKDRLAASKVSAASTAAVGSDKVRVLSADGHLKAVQSKKGPLLLRESADGDKEKTVFLGWPDAAKWDQITEQDALAWEHTVQEQRAPHNIGEWEGQPIYVRTGRFGAYVQCGDVSVNYPDPAETLEALQARLAAKRQPAASTREFKDYRVAVGAYGPYIMKTSLKKPQFVSLPKGIDPAALTQKEVENLYRLGLEAKKSHQKKK